MRESEIACTGLKRWRGNGVFPSYHREHGFHTTLGKPKG
jgi:hypothetical protein